MLGDLERAVMNRLWSVPEAQTVRQVHAALSLRRPFAYTTISTVLQRLVKKGVVAQCRDERAHRYTAVCRCDDLVAALMVDALRQETDLIGRQAALVSFVEHVGAAGAETLRRALAENNEPARQMPIGTGAT